jgi:outer membrane autotransporter protein
MPERRLLIALTLLCGLASAPFARAECGGTTQCIGVGPTVADAQVAHHGLGPATFTIDFGNQAVGSASGTRTIFVEAVTGPAGSQVQLSPTTITGADASSFGIAGGSCKPPAGPINGGPGCTIDVVFGPTSAGPKSATVHVNLAFPGCVGCITERVVTVIGNGVTAPASAPVAGSFSVDVPAGTSKDIDVAPYVSGSFNQVNIASPPSHGTAGVSGSVITYTPAAGYVGSDSLTYTATGSGGTSAPGTITINVTAASGPAAPTAAARAVTTPFQTPVAIDLATSISGNFTSVAIATQPGHGTATLNGAVATYTPAAGFTGTDTFTYRAMGPGGTSPPATVTITVSATAATAGPISVTVQINTPTVIDLANVVSGSGVSSVVIGTRPAHGIAVPNGLRVTYTPTHDYFGADSFTYSAVGVTGNSSPATVSITIVGRPDPRQNATVTGLVSAQAAGAERFAQTQIGNFQGRMESLHRRERPPRVEAEPRTEAPPADFLQRSYASATQLPFASEMASLITTGSVPVASLARGWTDFWVSGNARFGRRAESSSTASLEFSTAGLSLGADYRFNNRFAAGVGAGYARESTDIGTDGSRSKAHGYSIAAYASWQPTRETFIDGVLGYGWLDFSSRRFIPVLGESATADRDGHNVFGSIAAGYEYRKNGVLLSPYGRIDHSSSTLDAARETGGGAYALAYGSQKNPVTQGALGLRGETVRESEYGWANLRARAEYRHLFKGAGSTTIAYADIPGVDYVYTPTTTNRNSLALGLGTEMTFRGGLTAGIDYQYLRASARESDQGIRLYFSQDLEGRGTASWLPGLRMEPTKPHDVQVDAGFMYDDNVSRSQNSAEKLSDYSFSGNARWNKVFTLTPNVRAIANLVVGGEAFRRYNGLSKASGGIEGELQYRGSGAFGAPTFAIFANVYGDAYESRLRDGARYSAGVSARKALTDRLSVFGAYTHTRRTAEDEVFEGRDDSVRLNFDFQWSPKSTWYFTGEYRRGDAVGSGKVPEIGNSLPHRHDFDNHALEVEDDAFPGYNAYRFKGNTVITTLGYNWSVGPRESIDFSWRRVETKPHGSWGVETLYGTVIFERYVTNQFFVIYLVSF